MDGFPYCNRLYLEFKKLHEIFQVTMLHIFLKNCKLICLQTAIKLFVALL